MKLQMIMQGALSDEPSLPALLFY